MIRADHKPEPGPFRVCRRCGGEYDKGAHTRMISPPLRKPIGMPSGRIINAPATTTTAATGE